MWRAISAVVVSIALGNVAASAQDRHLRPLIEQDVVTVSISVHAAPTVSPVIVERTLEEAGAIWRPTGVTIKWQNEDSGRTAFTPPQAARPRVIIDESRGTRRDSSAPLGWVNFVGDEPDGDIHVSHRNTGVHPGVWRGRRGDASHDSGRALSRSAAPWGVLSRTKSATTCCD